MKIFKLYLFFLFTLLYANAAFAQNGLDKYLQGDKARKAKKYDIAVQFFQEAIKLDPKAEKYYFDMGLSYRSMGDMDKASAAFLKAISLKPDYAEAYRILAKIAEVGKKDYPQAAVYYKKAVQYDKDPKIKAENIAQAIKLMNFTQKYDSITPLLVEAKKLDPSNGDLIYMEIKNLNKLGQYDSAIVKSKMMSKNIGRYKGKNEAGLMATLKPPRDLDRFNYEIGYAYHKKGKFDSALTFLKLAKYGKLVNKVSLLLPEHQYEIASAYFDVFQYEKSKEAIDKALQMDAKYKEAKDLDLKIVSLKESVKGKQKGIKSLEDSVKANKDEKKRADVYCRLCGRQFETFDYEGAARSAEECLKFFPTKLQVVLWKSISLYRNGKFNEAIADLQNITDNEDIPTDVKARFAFALGIILKDAAKSPEGDPASQNFIAGESFKLAQKSSRYRAAARAEMEGIPGLSQLLQEEELQEEGSTTIDD
ncbi:MAG: tetratricopeptide repeat protein [Cytophagales bacterium]|nr:MAG: tetratricopeptide repeat protein [Cytophagales bacterium]